MRRALFILAALVAAVSASFAQSTPAMPGVTVTATLVDGQGNVEKTGFLHFELYNCGTYVPEVLNNPTAIVEQQFDLYPNPTTGLVSGTVYGNNQIYCGNVLSTQWVVTLYKATGQVGAPAANYCLSAPGMFNPAVNVPCTTTPPLPGFQYVFANPVQSQTWLQPSGTTGYFSGTFDFSQATVNGLNIGASASGANFELQYYLNGALAANPFLQFNPTNTTLTVGQPNPNEPGTSLAVDSLGYFTTSQAPPNSDNSSRLATTSNVQAFMPGWNAITGKPTTFPPPVPTTSVIGGVFMPADCPQPGYHVYGINTITGQLKCAADTNSQITLQANGVTIGTGLTTFNFVASAGLNIAAAVNQATGVITFTITGSTATQAQIPSFSPLPGAYPSGQSVTMTCASPSPTIYYTTNGTTPTHGSSVYSTPVAVTNTTLEAICSSSGLSDSNVQTGVYTLTAPAVTLSATTLPFGNQIVGTASAYQSFTITNTGLAALTISSIATSGDYSLTTDCGSTVNPGILCTVNVRVNPSTLGTDNGSVTITDNASGSPQSVTLTATGVQPTAALSPSSLSFGNQQLSVPSTSQAITVTNSSAYPLTVSSVSITGANANQFSQSNNCGTVAGSGGTCTVNVVFTPTTAGSKTATLNVTDNAASSPQTAALSGTGVAPSAPADSVSPSSLTFTAQTVGTTSAAQVVTMTNTGTAPLIISSVAITGSAAGDYALNTNCATVPVSQSCTASVTFTPTATGARNVTLNVVDNTTGSPYVVSISGTGAQPSFTLTPSSMSFGNQTVGTTSAAQTATLTNTGSVPLAVTSITMTSGSPQFAQTNNCGASLGVSNSCTINVTFTPNASTGQTGTLEVTTNAPSGNGLVSLTGTGVAPQITGLPSSAGFGCVVGSTCPQTTNFTIKNSGNGTLVVNSAGSNSGFWNASLTGCSSVPPGGTCTLTAVFNSAGATGSFSGQISLMGNFPGSPFVMSVTGTGVPPQQGP